MTSQRTACGTPIMDCFVNQQAASLTWIEPFPFTRLEALGSHAQTCVLKTAGQLEAGHMARIAWAAGRGSSTIHTETSATERMS